MTSLSEGEVLGGRYIVKGRLGEGGSADVYEAEHAVMGHRVAIKLMRPPEHGPGDLLERFEREMRISAILHHRHLLEVFDVGVRDDGSPFLVMELLGGTDLEERIAAGPLSIVETVDSGCQLLSALSALAGQGVIHRDVKPQNIMLSEEDGELIVKLVDFGIAQCPRRTDVTGKLTREGLLVGTPHYMAPEQVLARPLDCRADVYGAGAVLYEALTGQPPFDGETMTAVVAAVLRDPLTPVRALRPDCPPELERIVLRALARPRESRWAHPREMREALLSLWAELDPTDRGARPERPGSLHPPTLSSVAETASEVELEPACDVRGAGSKRRRWPWSRRPSARALAVAASAVAASVLAVAAGGLAWSPVGAPSPGLHALSAVESVSGQGPQSVAVAPDGSTGVGRADGGVGDAGSAHDGSVPDARDAAGELGPQRDRGTPRDEEAARRIRHRALAAYARGHNRRALALYRRSLAYAPDHAPSWRGLGIVADELGEPRRARRALHRYVQLAPGASDEAHIRTRLRRLSASPLEQ